MKLNKNKRYYLLIYSLLFFVFLTACTTPINMLKKKPEKYNGKKIQVSGKVISSLRLVDIKCFILKEQDSKICVVTPNFLPITGEHIFVKGVFKSNYKYNGQNIPVIIEHKKKAKKFKSWKKRSDEPVVK